MVECVLHTYARTGHCSWGQQPSGNTGQDLRCVVCSVTAPYTCGERNWEQYPHTDARHGAKAVGLRGAWPCALEQGTACHWPPLRPGFHPGQNTDTESCMLRVPRGQHTHPIVSSLREMMGPVLETDHQLQGRLAPLSLPRKARVDEGDLWSNPLPGCWSQYYWQWATMMLYWVLPCMAGWQRLESPPVSFPNLWSTAKMEREG